MYVGLREMTFEEQRNRVLPTFPNDEIIQSINQDLKSGEYHIIITRMEPIMLDIISKLKNKYKTSFGQLFFPFEEGIRLADLISWTDKTKEVYEHPMMITNIPKSIMTDEEVINAFLPDPKKREELLAQSKLFKNMTLCFIDREDVKAWKWIIHFVLTKQELIETELSKGVDVEEFVQCLPKPINFVEFYQSFDKLTRACLLSGKTPVVNPSIRLYTSEDQTITTFYVRGPGGDSITHGMDTITKEHKFDYYVKIIEAWQTDNATNEKKECLIIVARAKQGEVKRIRYGIIREKPEDDLSKILRFEYMDDVYDNGEAFPTFPSADEIKEIDEILKSGKHWMIITRIGEVEATLLSRIRLKYYPESDSDYKRSIFAFEEGTSTSKTGGMQIIFVAKSRMTMEQLDNELLPNPDTRNKTPPEDNGARCFLTLDDKDGWNWIDRLFMAMGSKKKMLKDLGLGGVGRLTTEEKRSLK
jgi:hypothetical protein